MKKILATLMSTLVIFAILPIIVFAKGITHTVVKGDSLWKIAVKYEVGLSEIKSANPEIENYSLIYPGDVINIPTQNSSVLSFEAEVVRIVNEKRSQNGLKPLKSNWELSRVARYKSQDMKDRNYFFYPRS